MAVGLGSLGDPLYRQQLLDNNPELIPAYDQSLAQARNNPNPAQQAAAQVTATFSQRFFGTSQPVLIFNPLSGFWKSDQIASKVHILPVSYLLGMVGYALALPMRVFIWVYSFINIFVQFFKTLCKKECSALGSNMKIASLAFLGATGELVSGAIGVVCPPLAYKIDELVQSNQRIHDWYFVRKFSVRTDDIEESALGGGAGNEHRLRLKRERIESKVQFYKQAHQQISTYVHEDEVANKSPAMIEALSMTGFLNALIAGHSLSTFKNDALDKTEPAKKEETKAALDKNEAQFLRYWDTFNLETDSNTKKVLLKIPVLKRFQRVANPFPYEGPKLKPEHLHRLILFEQMLHERDELGGQEYFAHGIEGQKKIQMALITAYFKKGTDKLYVQDPEVAKQMDAFFKTQLIPPEKLEELKILKVKIAGPRTQERQAEVDRMRAQRAHEQKRALLVEEIKNAEKDSIAFFEAKELFITVLLDGQTMPFREAIKKMVSEIRAFTKNIIDHDHEMATVVAKAAYD